MKTIRLFNLVLWSFLFVTPCVYAVSDIDVEPIFYDFGEVETGLSETVVIVINNAGNSSIAINNIVFETGSSDDYIITSVPYLPVFFGAGGHVNVEITFTPSDNSPSSAILEITSSDPDEGVVEVLLTGQGIGGEITPLEQVEAIVDFADTSVAGETLVGKGPGKSAKNRLNVLLEKIKRAETLVEEERGEEACEQLNNAYKHTDGQAKPTDFVEGPAASELASKIIVLIEALGCDS
jgi:hypothetical protein